MISPPPRVRPVARSERPHLLGGLLTAWLGAWLDGRCASDDLLTSAQGPDEPHTVSGLPDEAGPVPLSRALPLLRRCAPADVSLRLPVPGEPDGLLGPALAAASAAREGVAVVPRLPAGATPPWVDQIAPLGLDAGAPPGSGDAAGWLLAPTIDIRGSAYEPIVYVDWALVALGRPPTTDVVGATTLREAEHALSESVAAAAAVIAEIGQVGELSPEIVAAIGELRKRSGLKLPLPPGSPAEAIRVLTTAQRLEAVVELAAAERPLSAAADARRIDALRQVSRAVRDAYRFAFGACASGSAR